MTPKRPILAFLPLALLAACQEEAPQSDGRSASGEVLEGTISDAMLPIDTIRSEPPLEDPEAFREVQEKAAEAAAAPAGGETEPEPAEGQAPQARAPAPAPPPAD